MSDKLFEIVQLMGNSTVIQKDMAEAAELVKNHFREKYVKRIKAVSKAQHLKTCETPPKEVILCNALKEFAPEGSKDNFSKLADMFLILNSVKGIRSQLYNNDSGLNKTNIHNGEKTGTTKLIHEDGIYEIDEACLNKNDSSSKMTEFLFLMALMGD